MPIFLKKTSHFLHKVAIFAHISLLSLSTSTPKISTFDYLVNQHNFSPECVAKVSSSSSTKYLNKPQNADSILNFLKETGFSNIQIQTLIARSPRFLFANLETSVQPKVEVFQDLGFHSSDFAHIISASPSLLHRRADWLRQSILGLKNVLGPNADICRLFKYGSGRILGYDLDSTLVPNIEYLKSCGICPLQIALFVCRFPLSFATKPDKLKGIVERVDEMGVDRKSKMFIYGVRVMGSMSGENWELRLQVLRELGFTEQNITDAFRISPQAFAASNRKITEVIQLLLDVVDISYIARNPVLLSLSVEKRLKPRLRVLKVLLSKDLLTKKPSLAKFLCIPNAEFIKKYVSPYSEEVGSLYAVSKSS